MLLQSVPLAILLALVSNITPVYGITTWKEIRSTLSSRLKEIVPERTRSLEKRAVNKTVWVSSHTYQGNTFFDDWDFFNYSDPTKYVDRDTAYSRGLIYITEEGRANMHVDSWTRLTREEVQSRRKLRQSVRIHSKTKYNHGLFILDVAQAPFGCGTWPAYWMSGYYWPDEGEIDIIENVHSNLSNQVAWHTKPGCFLTTPGNFTGTAGSTICDSSYNYNTGCGIVDPSIASFGPTFNAKGGGVYAMKWDEQSIDVWFFYRSAIPGDILQGLPNPANWPLPSASLSNRGCDIDKYFMNLMLIFGKYSAVGCPGTCEERVMDPNSFTNATWSINYVKVYNKTIINTSYLEAAATHVSSILNVGSLVAFLFMPTVVTLYCSIF
ncbi:hypothetical protein CPB86DRAFT_771898 [Serendipita vermifera]|nr:hypothetical protein CPB86DRAFT_771898 [Serendipita vermifera]